MRRGPRVKDGATALDRPGRRLVSLKGAGGNLFTVQASDEVCNLPQLEVGDRVAVRYYEAIAAEMAKPGRETSASATLMRAPAGARPGAGLTQEVTAMVKITDLDLATHTVSFAGPEGVARTIAVQEPKMRDFVETLKVGGEVALTYTEALAISVELAAGP